MSTVEKEKDAKTLDANSGCCGVDNKDAAAHAAKVDVVKQDETTKEKKAGGCGCS